MTTAAQSTLDSARGADQQEVLEGAYKKITVHIIPFIFVCYLFNYLDRVNVGFAKLQMLDSLQWSETIYGLGAGIFFVGYLIFEIPGSLVASHFSATKWIARIMFTWGLVCIFMAFVTTEFQFFLCRFLLGASEASLYPVIYSVLFPRWFTAGERARATSLMLTSLLLSNIIGAPLAGVLLESSFFGMHGWQELFILEAVPALAFAVFFFFGVKSDKNFTMTLRKCSIGEVFFSLLTEA